MQKYQLLHQKLKSLCNQTKAPWDLLVVPAVLAPALMAGSSEKRKTHVTWSASPCRAKALIQACIKEFDQAPNVGHTLNEVKWSRAELQNTRFFLWNLKCLAGPWKYAWIVPVKLLHTLVQLLAFTLVRWARCVDDTEEFHFFLCGPVSRFPQHLLILDIYGLR